MGVQLLRISPFSSPRILIPTPSTHLTRFLGHIHSRGGSISGCLHESGFKSSSKSISPAISATGFGRYVQQKTRSLRGGVVSMAAPGSVQKSEEEWQAILTPEQFRILRQKGTELFGANTFRWLKRRKRIMWRCTSCCDLDYLVGTECTDLRGEQKT